MIEKNFDVAFVAELALREKQVQQNYRPVMAVHKWFARRPGTLFRSLLLSEFSSTPLRDCYYQANDLSGVKVADPFMGGGTPLLEANRLGCDVTGFDINPMAHWIVSREIEYLDLVEYQRTTRKLADWLEAKIGDLYLTDCGFCGNPKADVKYFLWVKTLPCEKCEKDIDLFSGYLLSEDRRHPKNVFVCSKCGELTEVSDRKNTVACSACSAEIPLFGPAKRGRCECPHCQTINTYPRPELGPPRHRMFAMEYHCSTCRAGHRGRFFKKPDDRDLERYARAEQNLLTRRPEYIPKDHIPNGDETDRLHRWGYRYYREMFNARQLLGLELSCKAISRIPDQKVKNALATNVSDLLRYQNMLCRYDAMALKSLDVFSVHGFPVGLMQCESNLLGVGGYGGVPIGSGGWLNITEKYKKAKAYCEAPFEIVHRNGSKVVVPVRGEWIGEQRTVNGKTVTRPVSLRCGSATLADLAPGSLDAVFTDPPYFGNVQYAELMDFCYVWLKQLVGEVGGSFDRISTRNEDELTGNSSMDRGLIHFTTGLSNVFGRMAKSLKTGRPLAFTFHHNRMEAYYPVAVSVLDSGLTCTASIPCPAEMGASIHISGTGSSIIDTIFVCRLTGAVQRRLIAKTPEEIATLVSEDVRLLRDGKVKPTSGDRRCLIFGHITRLAIWGLRKEWDSSVPFAEKLLRVESRVSTFGGYEPIERMLSEGVEPADAGLHTPGKTAAMKYGRAK
jgi:putative DNA methylase